MAKNKIEDLRNHLFAQLERLNDDEAMENPEARNREIERAKSIKQISDALVDTVKIEVDFLKAIAEVGRGSVSTEFIPSADKLIN